LIGLLPQSCGQGINLPFCKAILAACFLSCSLQLRNRRGRTAFAELAACIYADRVAGDRYTGDAGDEASPYKVRVADAYGSTLARDTISGRCADIDVIVAFYGIPALQPTTVLNDPCALPASAESPSAVFEAPSSLLLKARNAHGVISAHPTVLAIHRLKPDSVV